MKGTLFNPDINEFVDIFKELKSVKLVADYYSRKPSLIYAYIKKNNIDINQWKEKQHTPRFNPEPEYFIKMYDELKSSREMAKAFGVEKTTILNYAKKIGYVNKYRPELTKDEIEYICLQYYKKTAKEVAKEFNVSKSLIAKIWKENDLTGKINRTYYCNEHYFETIDTNGKAYLLGLTASDGCVYKRKNHIGMLSFSFHKQEIELLNIIQEELQTNQPILHNGNIISLAINSNIIFNDLEKYNIVPRKTWVYEPVDLLNDDLIWHYLRGYLDGDGSIYYCHNNPYKLSNWYINYCGNEQTIKFIFNFLSKYNISSFMSKDNREEKYTNDFYNVRIHGKQEIYNYIQKIYANSDGLRGRKYDKAMLFCEIYNQQLLEIAS